MVIDVGARGKQSEGGAFIVTEIYNRVQNNTSNVPPSKPLPGTSIRALDEMNFSPRNLPQAFFPWQQYYCRGRNFQHTALKFQKKQYNVSLAYYGSALEIQTMNNVRLLVQTASILHNVIRERDGINNYSYISCIRGENVGENVEVLQALFPSSLEKQAKKQWQCEIIK
ncbi:hypothetical protein PR048_028138 [Dryococelus australis]|uniref:Uncharacterized protein n=1 Tax=Dryococelus australis TaxID=614101 RepID=A0ABQ9GIE4_9NEOP|nr:hypothetical protein PR048_028138 [Dryococelus australis]